MKLLSRDQERYVFLIEREEHELLLSLLSLRGGMLRRRNAGTLSKTDPKAVSGNAELNRSLARHRRHQAAVVKRLLKSKATCVPTESGYGLTVSPGEYEAMLQAVNNVNLRAWEALGRPDFESGEQAEPTLKNLLLVRILHQGNMLLARLLEALDE